MYLFESMATTNLCILNELDWVVHENEDEACALILTKIWMFKFIDERRWSGSLRFNSFASLLTS